MRYIEKTYPNPSSASMHVNEEMTVKFTLDVNIQTLTNQTIFLLHVETQQIVPIEFRYDKRVLTVRPSMDLLYDDRYQLHLIGGAEGIRFVMMDTPLPTSELISFSTIPHHLLDDPKWMLPANQSIIQDNAIEFKWQVVLEAEYYELELAKTNTFSMLSWPNRREKLYNNFVMPVISFDPGTYYARVRAGRIHPFFSHIEEFGAWSDILSFVIAEPKLSEVVPMGSPIPQTNQIINFHLMSADPEANALFIDPTTQDTITIRLSEAIESQHVGRVFLIGQNN